MSKGLLGKKIGMLRVYLDAEKSIPATAVEVGPCYIVEINQNSKKLTLGFEEVKEKKVNKPRMGFLKKQGLPSLKHLKEFAFAGDKEYKVGEQINADLFNVGDFVDISGITKGKGFQGGVKRWHWKGGPKSHGSMSHRRVGSIGASSDPSRVWKGQHMPGQMGSDKLTVQNLKVIKVDKDKNLLLLKGSVPGHRNCLLIISKAKKKINKATDKQEVKEAASDSKDKSKGKK